MDHIRKIETDNSIWFIDLEGMRYVRMPKDEKPVEESHIPYTNDWEPYLSITHTGTKECYRILLERPIPFGSGQWRQSGVVVSDSHPWEEEQGTVPV